MMNDRFEYRVYNKRTEEMLDVRLISYFSTGNICRVEAQNAVGDIKIFDDYKTSIEDIELLQCTGLKDKNGKLIYEGDIVEAKHKPDREGWYCVYRGIAKYDNKKCQYVINSSHHKVLNENKLIKSALNTDTSFNWFDWFEVIGNIYENKDLLKCENQ